MYFDTLLMVLKIYFYLCTIPTYYALEYLHLIHRNVTFQILKKFCHGVLIAQDNRTSKQLYISYESRRAKIRIETTIMPVMNSLYFL